MTKELYPYPALKGYARDWETIEMVYETLCNPGWHNQMKGLEDAMIIARRDKKNILIAFTHRACSHCEDLKQDVFDKCDFGMWVVKNHVLLVHIDLPGKDEKENVVLQKYIQDYKVEGFPTVIGLSPGGFELGRVVGYAKGYGVIAWIKDYEKATSMHFMRINPDFKLELSVVDVEIPPDTPRGPQ